MTAPLNTDFTISDVLAWARTKPADERYDYNNVCNCALAQYAKARCGVAFVDGRSEAERYHNLGRHLIAEPWTFGGLVKRLETLCPDTVVTPSEWTKLDAYMADIEQVSA